MCHADEGGTRALGGGGDGVGGDEMDDFVVVESSEIVGGADVNTP